VNWHTVVDAVAQIGGPLVDDLRRVGDAAMLGIDEATGCRTTRRHQTRYATGLVDPTGRPASGGSEKVELLVRRVQMPGSSTDASY